MPSHRACVHQEDLAKRFGKPGEAGYGLGCSGMLGVLRSDTPALSFFRQHAKPCTKVVHTN